MNIDLRLIADKLIHLSATVHLRDKTATTVRDARLVDSCVTSVASDSVYIGTAGDILAFPNRKRLKNIICVDGGDSARSLLSATSANVLALETDWNVAAVLNAVQDIFEYYNACAKALMDAVVEGGDLQQLVDVCYNFFNNPVFLFDSPLMILAYACKGKEDELDDLWKAAINQGHTSIDVINDLNERGLLSYFYALDHAVFFKYETCRHSIILCNIYLHGKVMACLNVINVSGDLHNGHLHLAEFLASIIASVMKKHIDYRYAQADHLERLVLDQLNGNAHDKEEMQRYLSIIGWNMADDYYLLKVVFDEDYTSRNAIEYSATLIKKLFAGCFVFSYKDDLIAIINGTRCRGVLDESFAALKQLLGKRGLRGGLSPRFNDFSSIPDQYRLAEAAVVSGNILNGGLHLHFYGNCVTYHIIEMCSQIMNIRSLCHPDAITLHRYDKRKGTSLLVSLHTYLVNEKSLVGAANILGVHRNTLVHRLERIADMVSVDLDDECTKAHLILSYKILDYIERTQKR